VPELLCVANTILSMCINFFYSFLICCFKTNIIFDGKLFYLLAFLSPE
jgi:hypothetical protein